MFNYELRSFIDYHPTSIMPKMSTPMQWAVLTHFLPGNFHLELARTFARGLIEGLKFNTLSRYLPR